MRPSGGFARPLSLRSAFNTKRMARGSWTDLQLAAEKKCGDPLIAGALRRSPCRVLAMLRCAQRLRTHYEDKQRENNYALITSGAKNLGGQICGFERLDKN
jgi:hypothetical protein